jgi:predicted nucleotidyltransferase
MELSELAQHYAKKYSSVAAVIGYGSRVCGKPNESDDIRLRSHFDLWLVVGSYEEFYGSDMKDRRNLLTLLFNPFDEARAHAFLNRINPNFYEERFDDVKVKYGVVSADDFVRLCQPDARMYLKGRMQKPVRLLYAADEETKEKIEDAIFEARQDGVMKAFTLMPEGYEHWMVEPAFDGLIKKVLRLSYYADIRPEKKTKVDDIFEASKDELREMYFPFFKHVASLLAMGVSDEQRKRHADIEVKPYLRRNKWFSGLMSLKNGLTNKFAVSYLVGKIMRSRKK